MSGAKKIMNATDEIIITDEDRAKMQKFISSMTFENAEPLIEEYRKELDRWCLEFDAPSHLDLMSRADMSEFSSDICSKILEYYSFVNKRRSH